MIYTYILDVRKNFYKSMNIQKISDIDITNIKNKKTVFVSGVSGQTGSYMVEYLLKNTDYKIFGGARRCHCGVNRRAKNRT
jgi:hypothetical protein